MKRFVFNRNEDVSGVSGTGIVAEGVVLSSGKVIVSWLGEISSINIYNNLKEAEFIHGHDGRTVIQWID